MSLYHKMSSVQVSQVRALKIACIKGEADEKDKLPYTESYERIGALYFQRKWRELLDRVDVEFPVSQGLSWTHSYLYYVRAQAVIQAYLSNKKIPISLQELRLEHLPLEVKDYFEGMFYYSNGVLKKAYECFGRSRYYSSEFVNNMWGFVDSSIRGVNSAISFDALEKLMLDENIACYTPPGFEVIKKAEVGDHAHVIGCDEVYFSKFFDGFCQAFEKVAPTDVSLWVHLSNPSLETIEKVSNIDNPRIGVAIDKANFTNIKTYYTVVRFLLGNYLSRHFSYTKLCFSDIDVGLKSAYRVYLEDDSDFVLKKISGSVYPWRGVDAKFVVVNVANPYARDYVLSNIVRHFVYVYQDELNPRGNKQWWVDQYALALISDYLVYNQGIGKEINVKVLDPKEIPVVTAQDLNVSRDEFFEKFDMR